MNKRFLLLLLLCVCCSAQAQTIQDPLAHIAKMGQANRSYYKWVSDFNRDGVADILLSLKETPSELEDEKEDAGQLFNQR